MRPPPVVLFVAAFGAGLATGLARFHPQVAAIGALAAAVVLRRRDAGLVPGAALLGLLHAGLAHRLASEECAARLRAGPQSLRVVLHDAGRPGQVEAGLAGVRCRGRITVRWPARPAMGAGRTVTLEGKWIPRRGWGGRADGQFIVRRVGEASGTPAAAARLRNWITETAEARFGARAGLVDALVLNRRGAMDTGLKEAFARSGLIHLLSISGFHVGLITAWLVLVLRALRVPRVRATALGALLSTAYVAFLGWPAPATRAAGLGLVLALCLWRQRRVQPTPLLLITCLGVLAVDPWAIADLGAWLSATALWGAVTFTRWSEEGLGPRPLVRTLMASVGATLGTAPITAGVLGTVALAGIVLNFVGIPLAGLAVPGVLATLILSPLVPGLGEAMAAGTGLLLAGLERTAVAGGAIPGGAVTMEPGPTGFVLWLAVLGAALWALGARRNLGLAVTRGAVAVALGCWLWVTLFQLRLRHEGNGRLTVFFLRVGQGDATALRTPAGRWVLIDAGPAGHGQDAGDRVIAPFLARRGVKRLEALVVSHGHLDHFGGAPSVLSRLPAVSVLEPAVAVSDSLYLAFLDQVEASGSGWAPARRGDRWELDGVRFEVLHPDTTWRGWGEDLNEDSVVLLVEYGRFRALFTGDAGLPVEAALRGKVGPVQILKSGHHGSRTATGEAWLAELRPAAVVVSVGVNRYGHPSPEMLRRVATSGASLWRTDRDGTVEVRSDGRSFEIRGKGRRYGASALAP